MGLEGEVMNLLYTPNQINIKSLQCLYYVDDMINTGDLILEDFKDVMTREFKMTNLGLMKYF